MSASKKRQLSPIGERIETALAAENRTQTALERWLVTNHGFNRGDLSSLMTGRRGATSVKPDKVKAVADALHVQFEWLVLGRGAMRRDGRTEPTPAEYALGVARTFGIREDAWALAWDRNKDRQATMTAQDWFTAIQLEADHLNRTNVPKPEEVAETKAAQQRIARLQKKRAAMKEKELSDAPPPAVPVPKVSAG